MIARPHHQGLLLQKPGTRLAPAAGFQTSIVGYSDSLCAACEPSRNDHQNDRLLNSALQIRFMIPSICALRRHDGHHQQPASAARRKHA